MTYSDLTIMNGFIDTITFQLHRGSLFRLQINHVVDKSTNMIVSFRDSLHCGFSGKDY